MLFERMLDMIEIKKWFDPAEWDVGYLTKEQMKICSFSPTKGTYQYSDGWMFVNDIHFDWKDICNGIVLIKKSSVCLDYTIYQEATKVLVNQSLKENSDWIHVYTNFKEAHIHSARGVRARNSLVYNYKFGFDCKVCVIGFSTMIQNLPKIKRVAGNNFKDKYWHNCIGCNACREVCPVGAIHNNEDVDWLDSSACDEFLGLSDHPTIPSSKTFWHKHVRPDIPKEIVDKVTTMKTKQEAIDKGIPMMDWNANGYEEKRGVFYKDGSEVPVPICRECQTQAPCSDWGAEYPYDSEYDTWISRRKFE